MQTDQPFDIGFGEIITSKLATSKMSIFKLVSVAEETDKNFTMSEIRKTGFLGTRPILSFFLLVRHFQAFIGCIKYHALLEDVICTVTDLEYMLEVYFNHTYSLCPGKSIHKFQN